MAEAAVAFRLSAALRQQANAIAAARKRGLEFDVIAISLRDDRDDRSYAGADVVAAVAYLA
jgi:hypothetical protein